jgi:hypothetical protein
LIFKFALVNIEDRCEFFYIFWGRPGLAVKYGSNGYFTTAEFFGDIFERQLLVGLGVK